MKNLKLILIAVLLFSCNKKEKKIIDNNMLIGNWSSIKEGSYQEYYFDSEYMYIFHPYSGNTLQYRYMFNNDSIFRYFINSKNDDKDQPFKFYNKIIERDTLQIQLETRNLVKIIDSNTLEMMVDGKIDSKVYFNACMDRENKTMKVTNEGLEVEW